MSDTRVFVVPGWGPEHPLWCRWGWPQMTKKHQGRDTSVRGREGGKDGRFCHRGKNSRYNLERKNDALREKEALSDLG